MRTNPSKGNPKASDSNQSEFLNRSSLNIVDDQFASSNIQFY
jgi:hypothetical protein